MGSTVDVDQAIEADLAAADVLFELLDSVHASSIGNRPSRSCASFAKMARKSQALLRHFQRMDGYPATTKENAR